MTEAAAPAVHFAEEPWVFQQSFDAETPLHVFLTLKVLFCGLATLINTCQVACVQCFSVRSCAEHQGRGVWPAASSVLALECVPRCHGGERRLPCAALPGASLSTALACLLWSHAPIFITLEGR